jgi:hypothetical protein
MARPERIRLGDLLIQEALLTAAQLDEALVEQKKSGRKLGRIFIDRQWVSEVAIAKAVARQLRAPFLDLDNRMLRREMRRAEDARRRAERAAGGAHLGVKRAGAGRGVGADGRGVSGERTTGGPRRGSGEFGGEGSCDRQAMWAKCGGPYGREAARGG